MNLRPVHQNLDTTFVNLSALVKHLRGRGFAGIVRLRLDEYEAEILIEGDKQPTARELDRRTGRSAEGVQALERIFIRARTPGGTINVFRKIGEEAAAPDAVETAAAVEAKTAPQETAPKTAPKVAENAAVEAKTVLRAAPPAAPQMPAAPSVKTPPKEAAVSVQNVKTQAPPPTTAFGSGISPKSFTNNVETKARPARIAPERFQTLVRLLAEMLITIDKSLAVENLNFSPAFAAACAEISGDYPFLNPEEKVFRYADGKIHLKAAVNPAQLSTAILEAVRRVLERLAANPKFTEVHRSTVQSLLALLRHRKTLYEEFSIAAKLEKILGAR